MNASLRCFESWSDGSRNAAPSRARDSQSMHLAGDKRLQDQQVQSLLLKGCRFRVQEMSPIGILEKMIMIYI